MLEPQDQAAQGFLHKLFENCPGQVALFCLPSRRTHWGASQDEGALDLLGLHAVTESRYMQNVYVSTCPQAQIPDWGRGGSETTIAMPALWADIDIAGPAHQGSHYPPTLEDAQGLLNEFPAKPTILVHSGHGLQAWWQLERPWVFLDDSDREQAAELERTFLSALQRLAASRGWSIDPTADLARVMRMPGTFNRKPGCEDALVQVLYDDGPVYQPSQLAQLIEAMPAYEPARPTMGEIDLERPRRLGRRALEFVANGAPIGTQRTEALAVARAYLSRGHSVEDTISAIWRGLSASPQVEGSPWTEADAKEIVESIASHDPSTPLRNSEIGEEERPTLTDVGNAQRWAARWQGRFRYVPQRWGWLYYTNGRWSREGAEGAAMRAAKEIALELLEQARDDLRQAEHSIIEAKDAATLGVQQPAGVEERLQEAFRRAKSEFSWAMNTLSRPRLDAMIYLARSDERIQASIDMFDRDPWLFNCANGTINLRTGELQAHNSRDYITKQSPVHFEAGAQHGAWTRYMQHATDGDAEFAAYLQRIAGSLLSGRPEDKLICFLLGPSQSGKSTWVEAVKCAMGDYAVTADFDTFLGRGANQRGAPRPDLARMAGARMVAACETEASGRLAEDLLKKLTGGDTITVRHLYQEEFEFQPTFTILLAANDSPRINDRDEATWNRLRRMPFEHVVPKEKRDPELKLALKDPEVGGPAVLSWMVQGCLAWQEQGWGTCAAVERATRTLRISMDPLGEFLEENCEIDPGSITEAGDLRSTYINWTRLNGVRNPLSNKEWSQRLQDLGCVRSLKTIDGHRVRVWEGIHLMQTHDDEQISLSR
jgi:putative DNA primase/helicase